MTEKDDILLKRIANHLIMHASFMDDIGLYHGKMGVVLFFAHYGRYTGESLYDDFAGELLSEVCEHLYYSLPIDLENGLCGIGWGVEYLLQNGFIEGDSDEILSEIDNKIMERNLQRLNDKSIRTGLEGVVYYVHKRLTSSSRNTTTKPFDEKYLLDWELVNRAIIMPEESQMLLSIVGAVSKEIDIMPLSLGLENGCTGCGINLLLSREN